MTTEFVLLHGLGGSPAVWDRLAPMLARHGVVHALPVAVPRTVGDAALAVARELRARSSARSFVFVGHSLGGLVATSIAERFPSLVDRLVVINPPTSVDARLTARSPRERALRVPFVAPVVWAAGVRPALRRGLASAVAPGAAVPDFFVDDLIATGAAGFTAADRGLDSYLDERPLRDRVTALDPSVVVELVYGAVDQRVAPDALADLGEVVSTVTRIEGVGHSPQWELPLPVYRAIVGGPAPSALGSRDPRPAFPRPRLRPRRWRPPTAPARAGQPWETAGPVHRIELPGLGPEHVVTDHRGRLLTGLADGRILRITLADNGDGLFAERIETLADTGGRPLGMTVADRATLLVCDSERGLLSVGLPDDPVDESAPPAAEVRVLVGSVDGERLNFASNVDAVGSPATIYFSASTRRFGFDDYAGDLMEHSGTGRLLRRAPDGTVDVLADGLQFANGIRVAADGSFVDVAESGRFAVTRIPVTGTPAALPHTVIDNLPGVPDNMTADGDLTWVALASARNLLLDAVLPLPGIIRRIGWAGPDALRPVHRTVWVVAIDGDGTVVHDLQTGSADFAMVTSACPWGDHLILGSITETALGVIARPRSATTHTEVPR